MKRKGTRRAILGSIVFGVVYVSSYVPLSMTGGWVVSESGRIRITLAMADIFEWQPRYGMFHRMRTYGGGHLVRADFLGWFYSPLILIDQKWIHPTIAFIDSEFELVDPIPAPPLKEYHPTRANRFHGRFPYEKAPQPLDSNEARDSTSRATPPVGQKPRHG